MQTILFKQTVLALLTTVNFPFSANAQEPEKEVHIKIVENGVTTKDTTYTTTGDPDEFIMHWQEGNDHDEFAKNIQRYVYVMNDSLMEKEFEWIGKEGEMEKHMQEMMEGSMHHSMGEKREIWLDRPNPGSPCRTIIIHEGDCDGENLETKVFLGDPGVFVMPPVPPVPPMHMSPEMMQEHAAQLEKQAAELKKQAEELEKEIKKNPKAVKTEGGKKVMVIETIDEEKDDNGKKEKD
jgi:hypothetical protein